MQTATESTLKNAVAQAQASARAQSLMDPVKLIASDGSEIILDRRAAMVSGTIKSMLCGPGAVGLAQDTVARDGSSALLHYELYLLYDCNSTGPFFDFAGQFTESQQGEVKFPEINAKILEKVVQYFYYKLRYTNHVGVLPEFKIEPEAALDLLMAANFLDT